ncbi:MAG TPA: AAA family ATPase [Candidatus Paceibacterota bacterium]|nr:AAA family ATPase [Candidatus Paceibacterota bacterium]
MTQAEALSILKTGGNVFLTGEPGSGKTHLINDYVAWLRACGIEPSITAATGIAATHVAGMTLHSWSGIGVQDRLSSADIDRIASKEHVARRILKAKVLIIEEISMLSAATFAAADAICREVRRADRPFGGLTVVLVGDFFQLPPVSRGSEAAFAYESDTWRDLNPLVCYLTEQYRQDDAEFLEVLSAIRSGAVEELHYERLMTRRSGREGHPANAPKLFSHNADVDRLNAEALAKLPGARKRFLMASSGKDSLVEGLKRGCLSPETLELKEGAEVMFTKNSPQGKFVNGSLGKVVEFEPGSGFPVVELAGRARVVAEPMEWQVEEQGKVRASVSQVPLRLAYAMTVHKSQGMSMDAAVIDLSKAFEYGQGYVALSRVRRLDGVHLLGINERALLVHPEILEKDRDFRAASEAARERFAEFAPAELEGMQKGFVKAMGGAWTTRIRPVRPDARGNAMPGRLAETLSAVRDAKSLRDAAKARGLAVATIVKHLEELSQIGALAHADFAHLLPESDALDEIAEALAAGSGERLAPVYTALKGKYAYETIRLARLAR